MKYALILCIAACILGPIIAGVVLNSCKATQQSLTQIETMPQADFDVTQARVDLILRVTIHRVVTAGNPSDSDLLARQAILGLAATTFATIAENPMSVVGPSLLSIGLRDAGFSDDESMLCIIIAEDYLNGRFAWGVTGQPLGPRSREMLNTISRAIRAGSLGTPTEKEMTEASQLVPQADSL